MIKINNISLVPPQKFPKPHHDRYLRDIQILFDLNNTISTSHRSFPMTIESIDEYIDCCNDKTRITFDIYEKIKKENYLAGRIALQEIDLINRMAELALIIHHDKHGRGLGENACRAIINHGFQNLNLNKIYLGTPSINHAMIALAEKLGMEHEATLKEEFISGGIKNDILRFAIFDRREK